MSRPVAALAAGLVLLVPTAPAWAQEADTATVTTTVDGPVDQFGEPCPEPEPFEELPTDPEDVGVPIDAADDPLPDEEPVAEAPVDEAPVEEAPVEDEPLVDGSDTSTVDLADDDVRCFLAAAGGGAPQLPVNGPADLLLHAALGTSLVLVGAGAVVAGRRRGRHELA